MARITHAAAHLTTEEVKNRMRTAPRPLYRQRWLIIYNALVEPRKAEEIARHCGVSKATVHQVISTYNRFGVAAVETPGKGGRRHQYLTWEEEEQFLAPFFARAEAGEIATVREIWQDFEARVGEKVDDSTIYRLLDRHGWRKLMPRPRHPKADPQAQEQFKKTLKPRFKRQSPHAQPRMSALSSLWPRMKAVLAASAVPTGVGPHQGSDRTSPAK
jgi:transposase